MKATILISEEMERLSAKQPKEATKDIAKESKYLDRDSKFEHPEGRVSVNIDKVASDEEGKQMPEWEGANKLDE